MRKLALGLLSVFLLLLAGCGGVVVVYEPPRVIYTQSRPVVVYPIYEVVPGPSFEWTWSSHHHSHHDGWSARHRTTTTTTTRSRTTTTTTTRHR